MKIRVRQSMLSAIVFCVIMIGLVSVDDRVRDRFSDLVYGNSSGDLSPWGHRLGDLTGALLSAIRHQSIENAPLLVFATIGFVLFLFMARM